MNRNNKRSSRATTVLAVNVLKNSESSAIKKSLAASALSQTNTTNQTGKAMETKASNIPAKVSYEQDVCAWVDRVSLLIRERKFDELNEDDMEHLVEEIEDVSKSEHRELRSRMSVLLAHLLKWKYQPERRPLSISGKSWLMTIKGQREAIDAAFEDTPSLRSRLTDDVWIKRVWIDTLILARKDTGMDSFPDSMPWMFEEVLNPEFLPD